MMRVVVFAIVTLAALSGRADAYPQFQLSRDQMCTSCHLSPAGGGLLTENGMLNAETFSQWGTDPTFLNGSWTPPSWLQLGGDVRAMGGYLRAPQQYLYAFPMQGDIYARATKDNFSVHVTAGMRPAQEGNEALTRVWAREHYVQWQSEPMASEGLFVRLGHLMPVFGLRWVEHPSYIRRFGGTPLFSETYGASASYIKESYEAHASVFVENPILDGVRHENGGAVYGEARIDDRSRVGGGFMVEANDWSHKFRYAVTGKHYLPTPGVLLQAEVQYVNSLLGGLGDTETGFHQIVGNLMASYFVNDAVLVDVTLGHYDENLRISRLDRNAIDVNVHWFVSSHFEALLVSRYEQIGIIGHGGPWGSWVMLQGHYRL